MATEHIPQIDNLIKDFGKRFREDAKQASKAIEQAIKELKNFQESEEKSMLHNVTIKYEENKTLEKYWLMRAVKDGDMYGQPPTPKRVISEKECTHEPTLDEIAQFLSDSKADFVSVMQNYRFEDELPF